MAEEGADAEGKGKTMEVMERGIGLEDMERKELVWDQFRKEGRRRKRSISEEMRLEEWERRRRKEGRRRKK